MSDQQFLHHSLLQVNSHKKNQRTGNTAKGLASYEIACIWNSKYNVHVCMIQTNADFIFQQVRPNDVWTCVTCSYFIYKKLT